MNCYQKFYTNQIHSSSLLCQLATMWRSQVLCDAIIKSGPISIKAHRVVLVAACPMLQSMENASIGSHLEVRLASDIKKESINTFLQYLYEGFMLLTEDNCKDVEKIGRLLQVDSVIKCCGDFLKCLSERTGSVDLSEQYRYSNFRDIEFRHVRSSDMHKNAPERSSKRGIDGHMPYSPGSKRQRHVADDALTMTEIYGSSDHSERFPFPGAPSGSKPQSGTVKDSLELVERDPPGTVNLESGSVTNRSVSIAVASDINTESEVQVVNVESSNSKRNDDTGSIDRQSPHSRGLPPASRVLSEKQSSVPSSVQPPDGASSKRKQQSSPLHHPLSSSTPSQKPFALGSASQTQSRSESHAVPSPSSGARRSESENTAVDTGQSSSTSSAVLNVGEMAVVKIESDDSNTGGLDMYVDTPEDGVIKLTRNSDDTMEDSEVTDQSLDWSRDRGEGGGAEGDMSWFTGQQQDKLAFEAFKLRGPKGSPRSTKSDITPADGAHVLVPVEGSTNKACVVCKTDGFRTATGLPTKSYYRCYTCGVALCRPQIRNCFARYHGHVMGDVELNT